MNWTMTESCFPTRHSKKKKSKNTRTILIEKRFGYFCD